MCGIDLSAKYFQKDQTIDCSNVDTSSDDYHQLAAVRRKIRMNKIRAKKLSYTRNEQPVPLQTKAIVRKIKNRESAALSRQRKKDEVIVLKNLLDKLQEENILLKERLQQLENQLRIPKTFVSCQGNVYEQKQQFYQIPYQSLENHIFCQPQPQLQKYGFQTQFVPNPKEPVVHQVLNNYPYDNSFISKFETNHQHIQRYEPTKNKKMEDIFNPLFNSNENRFENLNVFDDSEIFTFLNSNDELLLSNPYSEI